MKATFRDKLVKLLQLTQSSNDHEALRSIRKANSLLKKNGMDWNKFMAMPVQQRDDFLRWADQRHADVKAGRGFTGWVDFGV